MALSFTGLGTDKKGHFGTGGWSVRTAFIETIKEIAAVDERLWLLCGDLGFSVLEAFSEKFPERYLNVGVAEQNMTGIAAGLAMSGKGGFYLFHRQFPSDAMFGTGAQRRLLSQPERQDRGGGRRFGLCLVGLFSSRTEDLAVMRGHA